MSDARYNKVVEHSYYPNEKIPVPSEEERERQVRANERERIAAFIDTGGALWGRSDLEYSDEDILNNLPTRIRNGEHDKEVAE